MLQSDFCKSNESVKWNENTDVQECVCVCTSGNGFWKACIDNTTGAAVLQL